MLKIGQRLYDLTQDQAKALIGAEVAFLDENGDEYERDVVTEITQDCRDSTYNINIANGEYIWLGCNDGFSIKIVSLPSAAQSKSETLDARIERLRAELAEAEAEKARDGAPEGWMWKEGRLYGPQGEHILLGGAEPDTVFLGDDVGDEAAIPFDALCAFVDRIRRDRGETPAPPSAPVSAPRGASSVAIPYGWEVGEDADGPVMYSDDYDVYIRRLDRRDEPFLTITDTSDDVYVNVPIIAMRAYLALCDK